MCVCHLYSVCTYESMPYIDYPLYTFMSPAPVMHDLHQLLFTPSSLPSLLSSFLPSLHPAVLCFIPFFLPFPSVLPFPSCRPAVLFFFPVRFPLSSFLAVFPFLFALTCRRAPFQQCHPRPSPAERASATAGDQ